MIRKLKGKILITGASGMLGSVLTEHFAGIGYEVFALYGKNGEVIPEVENVHKISADITKPLITKKFGHLDAMIHCAAITDVNFCEQNKKLCLAVNVKGTANVIKLARKSDAKLIFISTPMVFDGEKGGYKETDKPKPLNYYGKTKYLAEKEVRKYERGIVLRVNPIGIRHLGAHPSFIQWFVDMARNNRSFNLFTNVEINPISTYTTAKVIENILYDYSSGILHVGSREKVNKAEIWEEIVKRYPTYSGKVTRIGVDKTIAGRIASRPHKMWLDVAKAENSGYKMPEWRNELRDVVGEILSPVVK